MRRLSATRLQRVRIAAVCIACILVLAARLSFAANDVIAVVEAPDHQHSAVIFTRSFGAPGEAYSNVSITSGLTRSPWRGPNAFALAFGHSTVGLAPLGGPVVRLRWRDAKTLELGFDAKAEVIMQRTAVDGVRIVYTPIHLPTLPAGTNRDRTAVVSIPGFDSVRVVPNER